MSYFAEEMTRQMERHTLIQADVSKGSGLSQSQISKWLNSEQTSVSCDQLSALAPALSDQTSDHAALVRAHLLDEKNGAPGAELIEIEITGPHLLADLPRPKTKGERALVYLTQLRYQNPDLNDLLIDLARVMGADL